MAVSEGIRRGRDKTRSDSRDASRVEITIRGTIRHLKIVGTHMRSRQNKTNARKVASVDASRYFDIAIDVDVVSLDFSVKLNDLFSCEAQRSLARAIGSQNRTGVISENDV